MEKHGDEWCESVVENKICKNQKLMNKKDWWKIFDISWLRIHHWWVNWMKLKRKCWTDGETWWWVMQKCSRKWNLQELKQNELKRLKETWIVKILRNEVSWKIEHEKEKKRKKKMQFWSMAQKQENLKWWMLMMMRN